MSTSTAVVVSEPRNSDPNVLSADSIREVAPAVFASSPHEKVSAAYAFISTERLLDGLRQVGFVPVAVRQTRTRVRSESHACHLIRLRRRLELLKVGDAYPEVVILNSHDGTTAYHLRMGLHRLVCSNGLIVQFGEESVMRFSHRGNVVDDVIVGALRMCERFAELAEQVSRMERRRLTEVEQIRMAERALELRYGDVASGGMEPSQLLVVRRSEDLGNDLWRVMNRLQESLLQGGVSRRSATGRVTQTRRITAIRRDVQLNTGLWEIAMEMLLT